MLTASRVVPFDGYSGKAATGITYACYPDPMVMSLDGTTLTCGGSPSTDIGGVYAAGAPATNSVAW